MGGFRLQIGGTEIKGDTPDQTVKDALASVKRAATTAAEAFSSGDLEKFKSLAGQLILNNNLATLGAIKAAKEVFPNIPAESFEKVAGAGVLTFLASGDVTLTVYSVANEFLAIYPNLDSEDDEDLDPPVLSTAAPTARSTKSFTASCLKIWKKKKADGKVSIYAGFHVGPGTIFTDAGGNQFIWPDVDLRKDDIVDLTATDNLAPAAEPTVSRAKGLFTGKSKNSPGIGPNQVTLVLTFEEQ